MNSKCDRCYCLDLPWSCPARHRPVPGLCEHARQGDLYREIVRRWCREDEAPIDSDQRHGPLPIVVSHRPIPAPDVVIRGNLVAYTGYGQYIEWVMRGLESNTYTVGLQSQLVDRRYNLLSGYVLERMRPLYNRSWELMIGTPQNRVVPGVRAVWSTMWESTRLPMNQACNLNRSEVVIVPSQWVAEVFGRSGVNPRKLEVVPLGVDLSTFRPVPGSDSGIFRFGTSGRRAHGGVRKGHEDVIAAFQAEFPTEPDVRLSIKLWPDCVDWPPVLVVPDDPRIEVVTTPLPTEGLAKWYRANSVYVSGSWGEGFGLQPLQSMACGVPVIVTGCTGDSEYFRDDCGYRLDWTAIEGPGDYAAGEMARPTHESLRSTMRKAYTNHDGRTARGTAAATRAREFSWWNTGDRIADILAKRGFLRPRPKLLPVTRRIFQSRLCPNKVRPNCGCECATCSIKGGIQVTGHECIECQGGIP